MTPFDSTCFPGGLEPKASERFQYEPSPQEELEAYVGTWAAKPVEDGMVREPA